MEVNGSNEFAPPLGALDIDETEADGLLRGDGVQPNHFKNRLASSAQGEMSGSGKVTIVLQWINALCRSLTTRPARPGVRGTVRAIFNYPERGTSLRDTAWLDGLRGLAAFEVFIFHYIDGWLDRTTPWGHGEHMRSEWYYLPIFRTFYASGDAAVCLFFGISGYVLSYRMLSLLRQRRQEKLLTALSSAVFRRAIRLYMPVLIETFILMLLVRLFDLPKPTPYESAPTLFAELKAWCVSFIQLLPPLRYPDRFDKLLNPYDGGISWTIPLEYYGSIYVYTTVLLLSQLPSIVVRRCLAVALAIHGFVKDDWIASQFVMGTILADYQLERREAVQSQLKDATHKGSRFRPWVLGLMFAFGFYLSGLPGSTHVSDTEVAPRPFFDWLAQPLTSAGLYSKDRQTDRYILCIAAMFCIISVGEMPTLRRLPELRIVQYLGRISFGLYLCHIFVRALLEPVRRASLALVGLPPGETDWIKVEAGTGQVFVAYVLFMVVALFTNFFVAGIFESIFQEPLAEFLGVTVAVMFGSGSVAQALLSKAQSGTYPDNYGNWWTVCWGWGFGIMIGIYIAGDSGAYLNPALTLSQAVYRGFSFATVPIYFFVQFLGGFVGAFLTYANYISAIDFYAGDGIRTVPPEPNATAQIFVTFPQPFLPLASAFFSEVFATALLTISVFALKDETSNGGIARAADNWFPLKMFFIYSSIGATYGWETAFATNPARDFGPRIACYILGYGTGLWSNASHYFWIPLVAPFVGAMIGGFIYDFFVYTGPSPVNAPWLGLKLLVSPREEKRNREARRQEWKSLPEHSK
ncbi:aquaporin [Hortaea werneckii]|nr:aquaporin [Hortaea werneckii]